jgi:hypothetical protein
LPPRTTSHLLFGWNHGQLFPNPSYGRVADDSGASQFHSWISRNCSVSERACDRVQRLVERPSQMINFRAGVFGRTIQKLRQIVVLLAMRGFNSPVGSLLNSFL